MTIREESMKGRNRFGARVLGVLLVLVLVAAACGDDDDAVTTTAAPATTTTAAAGTDTTEGTTETTEGTTETTAAVTTTAAPAADKPVLVFAGSDTPNVAEPHTFRSTTAYMVTHHVFEPLIEQVPIEGADGKLTGSTDHVGAGAVSYTVEPAGDGLLATFSLRPEAKFENGDPVLASDYRYTFQRSIEGPGYIGVLLPFIGVGDASQLTVVDDLTFQIETTVQSPLFERFMTFQVFGALNEDVVTANATAEDPWGFTYLNTTSASSGPYYISEFSPDTQVVLDINPYYWALDSIANAGIVVRTVPDATQRAQLVRTGEIDVATGVPERLLPELAGDPNVKIFEFPTSGVNYMAMNVNLIPNVDLRRAIIKAVPYQALIDQVMFGYADPAQGVVTTPMETHDAAIGANYSTDLDEARALLATSGETDVNLVLGVRESRLIDQEAAVLIQENLRQVGINVEVQVLPDADWATRASAGELPMLIHDWFSWGEDPFYQMQFLTQCGSFVNYSGFCDANYDAIVDSGKFSLDPAVRQDASSQAQQIFWDNAVWAPMWAATRTIVTGKCVTGVKTGYSLVPDLEFATTSDC